jgi:membrane-anchored glycerophosphoryl diester phosphodiesterase (GDPDase)
MNKVAIGESIRFGWHTFKKRPFIFIGAFLLMAIISIVIQGLLDPGKDAPVTLTNVLLGIVSMLVGLIIEIGLVTFSLRAHDSVEKVGVKDLWNPKPFWYYLVGQAFVGFVVIVGLILLIVPGVIAAMGLMFSSYLIIDKGRGPVEAFKQSWQMTKGHKWDLFLLSLALVGLNILGLLALVIGLLVTIPITMLAVVHVYRKLAA